MSFLPQIDMKEVTRLTRRGQLGEAMALLQQGKNRPPAPSPIPATRHPRTLLGFSGKLAGLPGRRLPRTGTGIAAEPIPTGARYEEFSFSNQAGRRLYKLYVPSTYSGQPLPLVVMLHGCTQSPDDFAAGTRMNELAEEMGFLVAYPGQPHSANPHKCWNWFSPGDQGRDHGEPALIAGITRQVMAAFEVDASSVYIAGLSAGGAAAAIMGSAYPDLYAAIGVHSGLACGAARDMPSAFAAMRQGGPVAWNAGRPVPTIVFHGDSDNTVNLVNGDQVIAQAKAGADLLIAEQEGVSESGARFTRRIETDESGKPVIEQWVLHGAGHAWSGGSSAGTYTDPRGPDASREMMRFFLQHHLHA